jgi:hypothetical protein
MVTFALLGAIVEELPSEAVKLVNPKSPFKALVPP